MPKSIALSTISITVLMIVRPPGDPVTMNSVPFFVTIVGLIELSIRLPGAMRLAGVPMSPRRVRFARLLVEVAHLVVENEPGAAHDDVRAEASLERVGVGDGVAVLVDDREMRGLFVFVRRSDCVRMSLPSSALLDA